MSILGIYIIVPNVYLKWRLWQTNTHDVFFLQALWGGLKVPSAKREQDFECSVYDSKLHLMGEASVLVFGTSHHVNIPGKVIDSSILPP